MTITVVGHLCFDVIHHADGSETQSYGGIYFSLLTLARLLGNRDVIHPVFGVGRADYDELIEHLSAYPNIDSSGIFKFPGPTNKVSLRYETNETRIENSRSISEPIPWKRIKPFSDAGMILVNMISGYDITLETLDELRVEVRDNHTPVYMDVHSLTLGITEDGNRFHRPVELWRRWLFWLHAVQMNEEEAMILTPEYTDELMLAKQVLALNTSALIVTRGSKGSTAFVDRHKTVQRIDEPAEDAGIAADPTGCGDVFAAAYCAQYLLSRNVADAVRFATRVASAKALFAGSSQLDRLAAFRASLTAETKS